jgi:hypothetical protein
LKEDFMKILSSFRQDSKQVDEKDLREIVGVIRPLLKQTAKQIFHDHAAKLLTEPIDYIVPAVWGTKRDGSLDNTQEEIHRQLHRPFRLGMKALGIPHLRETQEFAIGYLLKEAMISSIALMIEMAKIEINRTTRDADKVPEWMEGLKPLETHKEIRRERR